MSTVKKQPKTIVELAANAKNVETLVEAIQAAGLKRTLEGKGPFTVFAPSDNAFNQLPKGTLKSLLKSSNKSKLQNILKYHVAEGRVLANDVASKSSLRMLSGDSVQIRKEGNVVHIGDAAIRQTNLEAENGVVHVIDQVLMPADAE
jgi:uncharacterized surface protein with fasciclin (FAS1) repeats